MTDVLELLLKESEEDETEWEAIWSPTRLSGLPREAYAAQNQSGSQMEQSRTAGDAGVHNERTLSMGDVAPILGRTQTLQDAVWSLSDRMTRLHKAARRREKRSVHPGGLAEPTSGRDALLGRGAVEQKTITADYAALVDAVFARDARRYDGPLRLL